MAQILSRDMPLRTMENCVLTLRSAGIELNANSLNVVIKKCNRLQIIDSSNTALIK